MACEELIALESYNLAQEMECYAADKEKLALIWQNESGNPLGVGEMGDIAVHRSTPALFQQY